MATRKKAARLFLLEVLLIRGDSRDSRASSAVFGINPDASKQASKFPMHAVPNFWITPKKCA
jgi:hypothetical protein